MIWIRIRRDLVKLSQALCEFKIPNMDDSQDSGGKEFYYSTSEDDEESAPKSAVLWKVYGSRAQNRKTFTNTNKGVIISCVKGPGSSGASQSAQVETDPKPLDGGQQASTSKATPTGSKKRKGKNPKRRSPLEWECDKIAELFHGLKNE